MTPFFPSPSLAAAYFVACFLLAATPGADMALFLSRTLAGGRAQGFAAQAGANVGLVFHTFAAALGLSALLAASAEAYDAVKIGGALYLLWLAWRAIRHGSVLKLTTDASARGGLRGEAVRPAAGERARQKERHVRARRCGEQEAGNDIACRQ